ncbi:MAG: zinc ribbon domain-containing protein [Gemmatimonadota bacterium]|nr:zinc ribbon domain-containing protein [Gemmatimonadota bacterium]
MLRPCEECGREISDRAQACPNCGAPTAASTGVAPRLTIDEWSLVRLASGSPRRQVVEELIQQSGLTEAEAETLVKRVESAAIAHPPDKWAAVRVVATVGIFAVILVILRFLIA